MRAALSLLLLVALAATGCSGSECEDCSSGFGGTDPSGFTSAGNGATSGTSGDGRSSLEGARAFTVANGFAFDGRDGGEIFLDDGPPGCNIHDTGASQAIHILLPVKLAIGSYGVGPDVDGGAAVEFFDFGNSTQLALLTAISGSVYVNRDDPEGVGGNFDVMLAFPDGGVESELSGIFGATPCF